MEHPIKLAQFLQRLEKVSGVKPIAELHACIDLSLDRLKKDEIQVNKINRPLTKTNFRNPMKDTAKQSVKDILVELPQFQQVQEVFDEMSAKTSMRL